jgi:hypothetical protein
VTGNFEEPNAASKRFDDGGNKTRGKACESGWYPCDSIQKISTVGHLGKVMGVRWTGHELSPDMPDSKIAHCTCRSRRMHTMQAGGRC